MRLGAELGGPLDVLAGPGVKGIGQSFLVRHQIARPGLAPLRLVRGRCAEAAGSQGETQKERPRQRGKPKPARERLARANGTGRNPLRTEQIAVHWQQIAKESERKPINKQSLRLPGSMWPGRFKSSNKVSRC